MVWFLLKQKTKQNRKNICSSNVKKQKLFRKSRLLVTKMLDPKVDLIALLNVQLDSFKLYESIKCFKFLYPSMT